MEAEACLTETYKEHPSCNASVLLETEGVWQRETGPQWVVALIAGANVDEH